MNKIRTEKKLCLCCMEEHDVHVIKVREYNLFKGKEVEYDAIYEYCDQTGECFAGEDMITANDISMKNQYRKNNGLLTTEEIVEIRDKYSISQKDLASLLGWGEKTITRYEGHQVQDVAHDTVIRKIGSDPEWFLELLEKGKDRISEAAYKRYNYYISKEYEYTQDRYLRKSISAKYVPYQNNPQYNGNKKLDFDKIVDVVNYFANSDKVTSLFKVKLMKLLWYADSISFKRYGHSMTGLVYLAKDMGALPVAHKQITELQGIVYDEKDFDNGSGIRFIGNKKNDYKFLSNEEREILDTVIGELGDLPRQNLVDKMHCEVAYQETPLGEAIDYKFAEQLSID